MFGTVHVWHNPWSTMVGLCWQVDDDDDDDDDGGGGDGVKTFVHKDCCASRAKNDGREGRDGESSSTTLLTTTDEEGSEM